MKKSAVSVMLLLCIVLLGMGCEKKQDAPIRPVAVYTLQEHDDLFVMKYPAVAEAEKEVQLSFKVSGIVAEFAYEVGAFVQKDQCIVRMDNRDYLVQVRAGKEKMLAAENMYKAAKAQADNARSQFVRADALYKENAMAKKKYEEAKAIFDAAAAKEKSAYASFLEAKQGYIAKQNQNSDTLLLAPYSGYIKHKFADVGTVVSAGMPVLTFSSAGKKKVQINISGKDMRYFEEKPHCVFVCGGKKYPLALQTVGKVKQSLDMVYPVVFYFEQEPDLLAGSEGSVHVYYAGDNPEALLIPVEAVFEKNNRSFVWVFDGNAVQSKEVKIIRPERGGRLAVSGLALGQSIVVKGVYDLYEGQKVRALDGFSKSNVGNVL